MGRVGRQQVRLQPQAATQIERPRDIGDEVVGAFLDQETVAPVRLQDAPRAISGFEHRDLHRRVKLTEPVRSGEPRNAPADDGNAANDGFVPLAGVAGGPTCNHNFLVGRDQIAAVRQS
jgi:hypothetical protein